MEVITHIDAQSPGMVVAMQLTAILCNHAEAQNNVLYVAAGGIDQVVVPAQHTGPVTVSLGVAIIVEVARTATDQQHTVDIALLDADGQMVKNHNTDEQEPFRTQFKFNVGPSRHVDSGETQSVALAVNIPALRLQKPGSYVFAVSVDEAVERRLPYRVVQRAA